MTWHADGVADYVLQLVLILDESAYQGTVSEVENNYVLNDVNNIHFCECVDFLSAGSLLLQ